METALMILAGIIGLAVLVLIGVQLVKIGGILKRKLPILYAIYLIFWILFGGLVAIGSVFAIYSEIENKREQDRKEQVQKVEQQRMEQLSQIAVSTGVEKDVVKTLMVSLRQHYGTYLSDKDIYVHLHLVKKHPNIRKFIQNAKDAEYTDEEIAKYYDLNIYGEITIDDFIGTSKKFKAPNDVIFTGLLESGRLDEYVFYHNDDEMKKMFGLE